METVVGASGRRTKLIEELMSAYQIAIGIGGGVCRICGGRRPPGCERIVAPRCHDSLCVGTERGVVVEATVRHARVAGQGVASATWE